MSKWTKKCTVGEDFNPSDGCVSDVADAVGRGADLRRFSTYNPESTGLVEETMSLQTTWVFDEENVGGLSHFTAPGGLWTRCLVAAHHSLLDLQRDGAFLLGYGAARWAPGG